MRRQLISGGILLLAAASVGTAVPGSSAVVSQLREIDPAWIAAALALELASCVSFVVVFRHFFDALPGPLARRSAWTTMGAGALLPGGGAGGLVINGLLLRDAGLDSRDLMRRSSALFFLTSATSVAALGLGGAATSSRIASGPHDLLRAGVPTVGAFGVIAVALAATRVRRLREPERPGLRDLVDGLEQARAALTAPGARLAGAAGYLMFDIATLWATLAGVGDAPPFAALVLAYTIGYIANTLPIPGGVAVLDTGLAGALVIYGCPAPTAAAAVLVYHAIAFWIPALGGLLAYASMRRLAPAEPLPQPA